MAECAFFLQKGDIEMYDFMSGLLADKKDGVIFTCFGVWHWIYIVVILGGILLVVLWLRGQSRYSKQRAITGFVNCAFGLYVLDFFLMPFAYGEIDIEKLPFHICTAMCVMCFLSRHVELLKNLRLQFAVLGLISNLVYLLYPAGIGWYEIHPLSYRAVQTLLFHGLMTGYGVSVLVLDDLKHEWRDLWKDLLVLVAMTLWALLGNNLYNGIGGDYSYPFNWFFVIQDPFYILPPETAKMIMPFAAPLAFFVVELIVYGVWKQGKKASGRRY